MGTLFGQIFSCCIRSSPTSEDHERTPLNPNGTTTTINIPRDAVASDRQKVKERLGNIVRSKEGKMVNVTDHLPFNLHNRDVLAASTSRLRAESPSPHPSAGTGETITTSVSGSSLRPPRGGRSGLPKEPALSVRLVKGREGSHRGMNGRGRLGRFGEERGVEVVKDFMDDTDICGTQLIPDGLDSDQLATQPEITPLEDSDKDHILALSEEISKQLREGWRIQDAGPISRGWGD